MLGVAGGCENPDAVHMQIELSLPFSFDIHKMYSHLLNNGAPSPRTPSPIHWPELSAPQ